MYVCMCYEEKHVGKKNNEGQQVWYTTVNKVSEKASLTFTL